MDVNKGSKRAVLRRTLAALTLMSIWIEPAMPMALVRVSSHVLMGAAAQAPRPEYPARAKSERAQGQVEVDVVVSPEGTVKDAQVISGHMLLRETARAAALRWTFDTAKLHYDQDVIGTLVFSFKLD